MPEGRLIGRDHRFAEAILERLYCADGAEIGAGYGDRGGIRVIDRKNVVVDLFDLDFRQRMVVRDAEIVALDDLVAFLRKKPDGALVDFGKIGGRKSYLSGLHLLQRGKGCRRGGGDLWARHPGLDLLDQSLVIGRAVEERGAGAAEQENVDRGGARHARGRFQLGRAHHFLDALHCHLRQLDARGMGRDTLGRHGPHFLFHDDAGSDVDQADPGAATGAVVAEAGIGSGCWRRMDREDIPADNLSSLKAGRLLFANGEVTRDKTSDKIANH
jgi:hypothetical protein